MVCLVNHDQIGERKAHAVGANGADVERGDRGNLDRCLGAKVLIGRGHDDAAGDPVRPELGQGLVNDLAAVGEDENPLMASDRALDDFGQDNGFSRTGRGNDQRPGAGAEESLDPIGSIYLVRSEDNPRCVSSGLAILFSLV